MLFTIGDRNNSEHPHQGFDETSLSSAIPPRIMVCNSHKHRVLKENQNLVTRSLQNCRRPLRLEKRRVFPLKPISGEGHQLPRWIVESKDATKRRKCDDVTLHSNILTLNALIWPWKMAYPLSSSLIILPWNCRDH